MGQLFLVGDDVTEEELLRKLTSAIRKKKKKQILQKTEQRLKGSTSNGPPRKPALVKSLGECRTSQTLSTSPLQIISSCDQPQQISTLTSPSSPSFQEAAHREESNCVARRLGHVSSVPKQAEGVRSQPKGKRVKAKLNLMKRKRKKSCEILKEELKKIRTSEDSTFDPNKLLLLNAEADMPDLGGNSSGSPMSGQSAFEGFNGESVANVSDVTLPPQDDNLMNRLKNEQEVIDNCNSSPEIEKQSCRSNSLNKELLPATVETYMCNDTESRIHIGISSVRCDIGGRTTPVEAVPSPVESSSTFCLERIFDTDRIFHTDSPDLSLSLSVDAEQLPGESEGQTQTNIQLSPDIPSWIYVALDCEMVGVGPGGKKSVLARCSIVDFEGGVLYDQYIRPAEDITDYRTPWSGIRPVHMKKAIPIHSALQDIRGRLAHKIVIGHAVYHDFKVLGMNPDPYFVRDTAQCRQLVEMAQLQGKGNSLKKLSDALLGRKIQASRSGHCSVEDARATLDLFKLVRVSWEAELFAKWSKKSGDIRAKVLKFVQQANQSRGLSSTDDFLSDKFWPSNVLDSTEVLTST